MLVLPAGIPSPPPFLSFRVFLNKQNGRRLLEDLKRKLNSTVLCIKWEGRKEIGKAWLLQTCLLNLFSWLGYSVINNNKKKTGSESQLNINLFFLKRIVCFSPHFLHIHQTLQLCQVLEKAAKAVSTDVFHHYCHKQLCVSIAIQESFKPQMYNNELEMPRLLPLLLQFRKDLPIYLTSFPRL